jgi:hypothetical protein
MGDFREAEKWAQEAVTISLEVCEDSPSRFMIESGLEYISVLQSLHIAKGRPELSEKIFEEIVERNFSQSFENVDFFAYLVKLSSFYGQYDYPLFVQSKCQKVLDMYSEHAESLDLTVELSKRDLEILGIVICTRSLLGHQLLNQGKKEEAVLYLSRFERGLYQFATRSKYFQVMGAFFCRQGYNGNMVGHFVVRLTIYERKIIFPTMQLKTVISSASGETVWQGSLNKIHGRRTSLLCREEDTLSNWHSPTP